jgi:two-component system C4-dicarboxylate transport response regulator DctD
MTPRGTHGSDDPRPALLVSRNPDILDLYVLALRNARVGLLSVSEIDEALQLIHDHSVSAVIVDVAEPGIDWEVCRLLQSQLQEQIPLIILTGWIDADARRAATATGCAAFVAKPATPDRLLDVVRRARSGERGIVLID